MTKGIVSAVKYIVFLLAFTLLATEVILRVFNPFPFRVKGNKIVLPKNQKVVITNDIISNLDPVIYHTKNNMGFRGPDMPKEIEEYLSIIAVGGSTTECYYISDSLTWPHQLSEKLELDYPRVWLNNAGLDGHSTYGHKVLLNDYVLPLKPKYVLFLIGCNDVERQDLHQTDQMQKGLDKVVEHKNQVVQFFKNNSELISLLDNIRRANQARYRNLLHEDFIPRLSNNDTIYIDPNTFQATLENQSPFLDAFRNRVSELLSLCQAQEIQPILLTQPSLFGVGIDEPTGGDLEKTRLNDGTNGKLYWQRLELYNDVIREMALNNGIFLIDLARVIPKTSRYFYDTVHFTNEGSSYVAEVIYKNLIAYFKNQNVVFN